MMKLLVCLCFVLIEPFAAYPYNGLRPQRTVMFGGYYSPSEGRSYVPQNSMTTFASGDTIATNSFVGDGYLDDSSELDVSVEETTEKRKSVQSGEEIENPQPIKPKRIPKRKQKDEDDDELPATWPFVSGKSGAPSYNAFFPITLGGLSGPRTRAVEDEGLYGSPSATAIANSFSTGKGGVATSHATSYGDPLLSSLFKNGNFIRKVKYQTE